MKQALFFQTNINTIYLNNINVFAYNQIDFYYYKLLK